VTFFILPQPTWRSHPQPILMQNGSNDVGLIKNRYFLLPLTPDSKTAKICAILIETRCQIFGQLLALKF